MKLLKAVLAVAGIGVMIGFLYSAGRLSGWDLPVAAGVYLLAMGLQLIVHECGHFLGGVCSGYRLLLLQLGALRIEKKPGEKCKLSWERSLVGQCIMIPQKTERVAFRAYNLGGIVANFLLMALGSCLLLWQWFYGQLLFVALVCVGVQKIVANSIPDLSDGSPNDGYVLWLLQKKAIRKDYALYLQLYEKLYWEESIDPAEFTYAPSPETSEAERLYYHEIQDILGSLEKESAEV